MFLAAALLNTQGHTAARSEDELPGPMPCCSPGKFYRVLTCNQQTQTPHLGDYQTKLILGSLKTANNKCEMMTHVMLKQDSGCACEGIAQNPVEVLLIASDPLARGRAGDRKGSCRFRYEKGTSA